MTQEIGIVNVVVAVVEMNYIHSVLMMLNIEFDKVVECYL